MAVPAVQVVLVVGQKRKGIAPVRDKKKVYHKISPPSFSYSRPVGAQSMEMMEGLFCDMPFWH